MSEKIRGVVEGIEEVRKVPGLYNITIAHEKYGMWKRTNRETGEVLFDPSHLHVGSEYEFDVTSRTKSTEEGDKTYKNLEHAKRLEPGETSAMEVKEQQTASLPLATGFVRDINDDIIRQVVAKNVALLIANSMLPVPQDEEAWKRITDFSERWVRMIKTGQ